MGQNIGTCVTALLSSIGVNRNAKRVAVVHISFNIIGTVVWLCVFYGLNSFLNFSFISSYIDPVGIAFVHSVFNLLTTALLFPFIKQLEKLARFLVKDSKEDKLFFLDERLIATPTIALAECENSMEGRCLSSPEELPDLVDEKGYFTADWGGLVKASFNPLRKEAVRSELTREIEAQIDRVRSSLPAGTPLRLDSHQHTHMFCSVRIIL